MLPNAENEKETLDPEEIEKYLPLLEPGKLHKAGEDVQDVEPCMICLEPNLEGQQVRNVSLCGHRFHSKCLLEWISLKLVCPNCKRDFSKKSLVEYENNRLLAKDIDKAVPRKKSSGMILGNSGEVPNPVARPGAVLTRVVVNRSNAPRSMIQGRSLRRPTGTTHTMTEFHNSQFEPGVHRPSISGQDRTPAMNELGFSQNTSMEVGSMPQTPTRRELRSRSRLPLTLVNSTATLLPPRP